MWCVKCMKESSEEDQAGDQNLFVAGPFVVRPKTDRSAQALGAATSMRSMVADHSFCTLQSFQDRRLLSPQLLLQRLRP